MAKRDHQWKETLAREIVPGDVIALKGGDVIPADARVWKAVEGAIIGQKLFASSCRSSVFG